MQKYMLTGLIFIMLFTLSACGAHTYTVELKDGREYVSDGEPDVNAYDWVSFKTTAGKKVRIKLEEVSVIREN
ncbi:MAG: YgdI/YgdR family lipoprotein [bacterium]|nr:YgdI/YgdR family lipoprotein [bacterium]